MLKVFPPVPGLRPAPRQQQGDAHWHDGADGNAEAESLDLDLASELGEDVL